MEPSVPTPGLVLSPPCGRGRATTCGPGGGDMEGQARRRPAGAAALRAALSDSLIRLLPQFRRPGKQTPDASTVVFSRASASSPGPIVRWPH